MDPNDRHGETAEDARAPKKRKPMRSFFKTTEGTTLRPSLHLK